MRALIVSEGSGGHLIPALEVSRALAAAGGWVGLLYPQRPRAGGLITDVAAQAAADGVQLMPWVWQPPRSSVLRRGWELWQSAGLWYGSDQLMRHVRPDVVAAFGGLSSVPVVLAARSRSIPVLLHEQNVQMGRANRWLAPWATRIALSFPPDLQGTHALAKSVPRVMTGLPIRAAIGHVSREDAARQFGLDPQALTVAILGGSQGSHAVNRLVCAMVEGLAEAERQQWQFVHLTGPHDGALVARAYGAQRLRCWMAPHLADMALVYALADVAVTRAGASTIAELAAARVPAVFIPYPHAGAHQRANAQLVESVGGGLWIDEAKTTPAKLLGVVRQVAADARLRQVMGTQIHTLARPDATRDVVEALTTLAGTSPAQGRSSRRVMNSTHIHFIGIGGIGMSGLARVAREEGAQVTGCDSKESRAHQLLRQQGIDVDVGHQPSHLTEAVGVVVYSSAVSLHEPELVAARARGIRTISRGEYLAEAAADKQMIAVAGAHGKTTTAGMAGQLLVQAGWDPTVVVGGYNLALGTNARSGCGRYLVAETDESDGSFLYLHPSVAIVTNIDREHLNYYQTFDNLIAAFRQFVEQVGPQGRLIRCNDDPVARRALSHPQQLTYGLTAPSDVMAQAMRIRGWGSEFEATYQGRALGTFRLQVPGRHNVLNALGVIALGLSLDLSVSVMREALWAFQGTARRFQRLQLPNDVLFVEDYAHHPSEIRATLDADPYTKRHRLVVFQPHRFSRTKLLEQEFSECFERADGLIITDVYSAFEPPIEGVSGERLASLIQGQGHPCVRYVPRQELHRFLPAFVQPHDTVFFLGAGDIGELCHDVAAQLRARIGTAR
jgi:UDP-N-acetylmuramate--alanine ligase